MTESDCAGGSGVAIAAGPGVTPMKRVVAACLVGSTIEFYDFAIYGTAAALVFPTVFFPHLSPAMATTASVGTYAAAFVARPVGAVGFGYFGDRLGRKTTLIATLMIMGLSTMTVGLVPGTAVIGVAAPLILICLRLLQGFSAGGEWAGSALLSAEYSPAIKRGRYSMFTVLGGNVAGVLASLTFLGVNLTIGADSPVFLQWGWRLPFLISAALIGIGLYVRLHIDETPVFAEEKARRMVSRAPLAELLRLQRRDIGLAVGVALGLFSFSGMVNGYVTTYAHAQLGYSRNVILVVGVLGALTGIAVVAFSAILSDRVGRRRVMLVGWAACLPWALQVMPLVDTGNPSCYAVAMVGTAVVASIGYGPIAAFIPELFPTRYRYNATALAINLASVAGGAVAPLVAGALQATYGPWAVGLILAALAAVSLVCTNLLPEMGGTTLRSIRSAEDASVGP